MDDSVVFDEERNTLAEMPIPRPEHRGMTSAILKMGIVNSPGDAAIVLAVAALLLIAGSFYLLASAIPTPPTLGTDTLRPGETIPTYAR